jgi:hypothetical protein
MRIHEEFDGVKYIKDIALIKLKRSFNPSSTTTTLCIPFDEKETSKNLYMGEWNVNEIKVSNPNIKEISVNGIDNVKCGQEFLNFVETKQFEASSNQIPENPSMKKLNLKVVKLEQFCADKKCEKLIFF